MIATATPGLIFYAALGANLTTSPGAWAWTDVSNYVRARSRFTTTQGRLDTYSLVSPATADCTVNNTDGRWVARNPTGAWSGLIGLNTPLRVDLDSSGVPAANDTFTRVVVDGWGTASLGGPYNLSGSGGVVAAADFDVTGTAGTISVPVASAYRLTYLNGIDEVDVDAYVEMTVPNPTGGNLEPGNLMLRGQTTSEYYDCRVFITTGLAVQVQVDHAGGATLVAATTVAGLTHAAATPLKVRAQCSGTTIRMRVWQGAVEPTVWHASAVDPNPIGPPGFVGIRTGRGAGNTNAGVTTTYDNLLVTVPPTRFDGFISDLPIFWDGSPTNCIVDLGASGVLRRMQQGDSPLKSAVYRALTSAGSAQPVDYWPMEDMTGATYLASATGGEPMSIAGLNLAQFSSVGSAPIPTTNADVSARAHVQPFSGAVTSFAIRFVFMFTGFPAANVFPLGWFGGGTLPTWGVVLTPTALTINARDIGFVERLAAGSINVATAVGTLIAVEVKAAQNGADIDWELVAHWSGVGAAVSGTVAGQTIGQPTLVQIANSALFAGGAVGHIAIYDSSTTAPVFSSSYLGWAGTDVASRIGGLCADAGVPVQIVDGEPSTLLGAQGQSGILALIRDAEAADMGILSEAGSGLRYLSRWQRYNQTVAMTLDYRRQIGSFEPVDNDQQIRNAVTVTRTGGSSATAQDLAHIARKDRYESAVTVNVFADTDLPFQAQWRVHVGTDEHLRYPKIGLNLRANPELITAWKACRVGSRITITNPPAGLPPDPIDLLIEGWTETIDPGAGMWLVDLNCSPADPWNVGFLDLTTTTTPSTVLGSNGSLLFANITATQTTFSIGLSDGSFWSDVDGPISFVIDGEVMTTTSVGAAVNPQSVTVTRAVNGVVKTHAAGATVAARYPLLLAL